MSNNAVEWDGTIQRFEFIYEACWRAAKQFLYDIEGVDVAPQKSVICSSRQIQLYVEEVIHALNMVNY
ncbi:MAG: nucleotidyltransferase substrate binding protein [Bacillus sp. (in: Bacteria)]|nr:nucleotidyltransferase substrate binding protein [Bacillus sp. (in: firmicutes)]